MYLGHADWAGVTEAGNLGEITRELPRNEAAAKGNGRQIDPAILSVFPHKGEVFQQNTTAPVVVVPALARDLKGSLRGLQGPHLYNRQVGDVGPFFLVLQDFGVQLAVEFAHPRGCGVDPNEYGGGHGDEGFNLSQSYLEGLFFGTYSFEDLQGSTLSAQ